MTTNATNPTGIGDYDLTPFARLPEWQRLSQALNAAALAADAAEIGGGQDAFAAAAEHLARGVAFMDGCRECRDALMASGESADTSAAPYVTRLDAGRLRASYRCRRGHEWTCNWALSRGWL